jgi:hypothetical protein
MNKLTDYLVRGAAAAQVLQSIHQTGPIDGVDVEEAKRVLAECCEGIVKLFTCNPNHPAG